MAFMPGDNQGKMPRYADLEWFVQTTESEEAFSRLSQRKGGRISQEEMEERTRQIEKAWAKAVHATQRIDLQKIITPDLIERVQANAQTTQLKLIMTFKGDQLNVRAEAYQWR